MNVVDPVPFGAELNGTAYTQFFERLRAAALAANMMSSPLDPTPSDIPTGSYRIWTNKTTGITKLYVNVSGTLQSVTFA